jgi:cold shock CspA family protein
VAVAYLLLQAMAEEHYWYYMDSTGQEFGPYPSSTMKGWFQQGFFPMQGELQVRLQDQGEHHYIKELYPEPIMERAFDGPPNMPGQRNAGGRGGGRGNRSSGGGRAAAAPQMVDTLPYDGGLGLWAGMMPGAMQSPGMSPFGLMAPGMRMPGMMPGMGGLAMPGMGGMGGMAGAGTGRFQGRIKSFNVQKGFGFIECPEAHQIYGRDVFLHKAQIGDFEIGRLVTFAVEMNKNNMPQARDLIEADPLGMSLGFGGGYPGMGMTGAKGGSNSKGGGKGKGRGGGGGKGNAKAGAKKAPGGGEKKNGGGSQPKAAASPKQIPAQIPQNVPMTIPQPAMPEGA